LEYLSEDTIKRATLSFMKTYYKFRPRVGETIIHYDMMHPSGVIVDGHLTYPKEDGTPFIATFEATSSASSAEVTFSFQRKQLIWDAIAIGSLSAVVVMFAAWYINLWSIGQNGWILPLLATFIIGVLGFLGYQMFFSTAGRYRYIYAIEQFKQYHADEQWIALGDDVFSNGTDPNFAELKMQCVKNGFGLLTVDKDEHINLLITPAREEVFGKKRLELKFEESPSSNYTPTSTLRRLSPQYLGRFSRPYRMQLATLFASVLALSGLFYRSYQLSPIKTVNAQAHRDSMMLKPSIEEPPFTVVNPEDMPRFNPNEKPYPTDATRVSDPPISTENIGLYVYSMQDARYIQYECARLEMQGTKYIVQDLTFRKFEDAIARLEYLKTMGLIGNIVSLSCALNTRSNDYAVFYELIYADEKSANTKAAEIVEVLSQKGQRSDYIKIRVIQF
jgi:hypothetical protein